MMIRLVCVNKSEIETALDGERFLLAEEDDLEREAEELIKWGANLDFEKYSDEWFFKSTIFINIDPN